MLMLINPVGGGSSASGYCLTLGKLGGAEVIGVQSEEADAMYKSWDEGHLEPQEEANTFAEGIATRVPFALTMEILRKYLKDFKLVSEDSLREALNYLLNEDHILAEGAGAASVAAALEMENYLSDKIVVLSITGGNFSNKKLKRIVEGE